MDEKTSRSFLLREPKWNFEPDLHHGRPYVKQFVKYDDEGNCEGKDQRVMCDNIIGITNSEGSIQLLTDNNSVSQDQAQLRKMIVQI